MAEFKAYGTVGDDGWSWDFFTAKMVGDWIDANKEATELTIRINTNGGLVSDAFLIYDLLRNSGKKIITIAEGMCYSSGTIIFLAAEKENRKCFENADFGIHFPQIDPFGLWEPLNSDDLDKISADLKKENERILNLYVDRTGADKEALTEMMKAESTFNADKAIELGFVDSKTTEIVNYIKYKAVASFSNNHKTNIMNKQIQDKIDALNAKFDKVVNLFKPAVKNYMITTSDGATLTVEIPEGQEPAVGDTASPDGTFVLDDGNTIIVEGGVITSIEPTETDELETLKAENEGLKTQITDLQSQLDTLNAAKDEMQTTVTEAMDLYNELKKTVTNYKPDPRTTVTKTPKTETTTSVQDVLAQSKFSKKQA